MPLDSNILPLLSRAVDLRNTPPPPSLHTRQLEMKTRAPIDLRVSLYAHSQPITVWVDVLYSVPIKFDDVSAPSITIVNARCRAEQRVWLLCIQAQFSLSIMYSPASRLEVDLILFKNV
jgi:hypothetical protein